MKDLEKWAEKALKDCKQYYVDLEGKLSEINNNEELQNKQFYEFCWTDRSYTYFSNDGKFIISSAAPIEDYSVYIKLIEEL